MSNVSGRNNCLQSTFKSYICSVFLCTKRMDYPAYDEHIARMSDMVICCICCIKVASPFYVFNSIKLPYIADVSV